MRILHLLDSLVPSASTWHVQSLSAKSAWDGDIFTVCCLGADNDLAASLRRCGMTVQSLGWSRWFDPRVLPKLRRILKDCEPDVIHVWDRLALRMLAIAHPVNLSRIVYTNHEPHPSWWDQRLANAVRQWSPWDSIGVADAPVQIDSPIHDRSVSTATEITKAYRIVSAGWDEVASGFRNAVWALDFLRHHYTNLRLDLVGVSDESGSLQQLSAGLELQNHLRFHAPTMQLATALADADIVWLPSVANCGAEIACAALAARKPIVASDVPCLRAVLHGESASCLVPVNDVTAFTRATHRLLRNRPACASSEKVDHGDQIYRRWKSACLSVAKILTPVATAA